MSEFEEKLNSILSSPEELQKITQLAQSFMGGGSDAPATAAAPAGVTADPAGPAAAAGNVPDLGDLLGGWTWPP